ncbi:prepilin peptidase [Agarilytica rhodophyticola]|uniref:prepilin peptidase n=1 Tax=Agarilytica rhodophyticola TaxID=1737490 RepID=UPI000B340F98|nr:A24 family peptidase [Agarilytica rhodophyticola]
MTYLTWINELFVFFSLIIGLLVGSFLNVVAYRLPLSLFSDWHQQARDILIEKGEIKVGQLKDMGEDTTFNIAYPASHCPACKTPIKPWHNIPVISYIFLLKGKCHYCGAHISARYPIVEFVTGLLTAFVVSQMGLSVASGFAVILTWSLIALTLIDIDHQLLPDDITYPLLWLGIIANLFGTFTSLNDAIIGAISGYLFLWSIYWIFKLITKKEGMGYGDFKLLAALGAWMGWQALPLIVILSSLVGAIIGICGILIYGKDKNKPIPFGPYLAIAGWIAFLWGDFILSSYLQMLKLN